MDIFDMEFPELPSIAPDLMFEEPMGNLFTPTLTQHDRETLLNFVLDDHAYAKPYPILSTANNKCITPQTILKLHPTDVHTKKNYKRNQSKYQSPGSEDDDEIDVTTVDGPDDFVVKYDKTKAHNGMNEVESYLNSLWKDVNKDDDEKITRGSWSKEQARLFDVVYKLINNYQLAKLAYVKNSNEPVLRKLALDKATHRIRKAFGSVLWNPKYIVWLHGIMIDGLGSSLFLCYLEILQSLKRKAPILFERVLLFDRAASEKELTAGLPNLGVRLKKSWDPSTGLQSKVTVEKFPTTPFLIMVPSGPNIPHQSTKRNRFWNNQLMNFGKVFPINVPAYRTLEGYVIKHYLEHCISAIRSKITEFRNRFPERHVVLVGWGIGSLISLKVANLYKVDAIICLGFPCNGIDGDSSEEYWKSLTKIECPILFVLGTHATSNSVMATEKLREQMKTQTNLMLIESADEMLRLTNSQKKALGMTQNMIDKLIQDQIYLFLKSVLFTPKPVVNNVPKGPMTGKKRKKKIDSAEKGETKKKKKSIVKVSLTNDDSLMLPPLDVSISSVSSIVPLGSSQGLLTTGSVSTSIPVTQLQSESLTTFTSTILHQTVSTSDVVVSTSKDVTKRNIIKEPKEKIKKPKNPKKSTIQKNVCMPPSPQKFTSTIGNQQFSAATNKSHVQQPVAFQRVPAGSFVLSGASGQIRLQGGANILYLQQTTSGATQLLSTPVINTSSGAFTAVISSNLVVSNPPKINIVPSSNFKFGPANPTLTPHKGLSAIISSGGCGNLVITSTSAQLNANASSSIDTLANNNKSDSIITSSIPALSVTSSSSFASPSTAASVAPVATTSSSTIMTHLSANDLRYLASLIAKHTNSRPNSPRPSSSTVSPSPLLFKTDDKTAKTSRENNDSFKLPVSSTSVSDNVNHAKTSFISILDKKVTLNTPNQSSKKIVQPPSLAQRVASIQQKDPATKMKTPRLKTSKLVSTTVNMPMSHIITANTTKSSLNTPNSKVLHKVPVTLTIPISRLPSTLNFSSASALSKSIINVPVLSSYLSQEKLIATTTKPSGSSSSSRTIVSNPSVSKKSPIIIGNVPVCGSPVKMSNMAVFPTTRSPTPSSNRSSSSSIFITKTPFSSTITTFKSPVKGKNPTPITLHLPSQATLKDPKVLRKAVSDVKVVGVLSQQSKSQIPSLVNLSTLRSISNPSSPLRSPSNDSLHGDMTPEELSPIQPRESAEIGDLKSEDRKRNSFSPLKSTLMAAIGDNVKPLTPPSIPSSTLLAASVPRDLSRSNITGKVGTGAFLGKLFVGPKSIVDPMRGKVTLSKEPHIHSHVSTIDPHMDVDPYDEDDDDDDDDDDESDVDFAISPAVGSPVTNTPVNKPVVFEPIKHSNITKIVYAPNHSSEIKTNLATPTHVFSKNILDIARAKLRETQFRCAGDGLITVSNISEPKSSSEEHISPGDSKLRFEPLKISSTRAKLTSVLSMRENRIDDSYATNLLHNTSMIASSIIDSKTSLALETPAKEHETNVIMTTLHSNRPTIVSSSPLKQLSLSCPAPIANFTLVTEKSSGVHGTASLTTTETSAVATESRNVESKDTKQSSITTNGVTSHDTKETPPASIQYKVSFSNSEPRETSLLSSLENKGTTFLNIDGKKTPFANVSFKGTSFTNPKMRGIPMTSVDSKGTFLGNIEGRGISFSNIDSKVMHFRNIGNRAMTFPTSEAKGTSSSIDTKYPSTYTEVKGIASDNIETGVASFNENSQITKRLNKQSKAAKQAQEYNMIVEEEPQPYITRSGRLMRSKYSIQYIDELDRKKTPKKRRLSSSSNQDNLPLNKKNKVIPDVSPTSSVTLENLVEAAKLITKGSDTLINGRGAVVADNVINHVKNIPDIDPTTNIAATAMLELLSGEKGERNIGEEMADEDLNNSSRYDNNRIEKDCFEGDKSSGLLSKGQVQIPISNGSSHIEKVNLELPVSRVNHIKIGKPGVPNVNPILKNPTDPSLPSLAPIPKVSTGIQSIPAANIEHIPVKSVVEGNVDITDTNVKENYNEHGNSSPIPPLAAIQDKCNENELNVPIDLLDPMKRSIDMLDPMKRSEFEDEISLSNNNIENSLDKDKMKPVIPSTENVSESTQQIGNLNKTALNLTSEENIPSLAVIQDKTVMDNSAALSCAATLIEQNNVVSSVVATASETFVSCVPVLNEHNESLSEVIHKPEIKIKIDETLKKIDSKVNITELTSEERTNNSSLSGSVVYSNSNLLTSHTDSSLPALAVIQNKTLGNTKFNDSNIMVTDNCSPVNKISNIDIVNSLPPLAAIQMNSTDNENLNQSNSGKLNPESDLNVTKDTNKNKVVIERDGVILPGASVIHDTDNSQSIPDLSPVSKTFEIPNTTNDVTVTNRNFEIDSKVADGDSKQEFVEGKESE